MSQSSDSTEPPPSLARTSTRSSLLDVPGMHDAPTRPQNISYISTPAYESPLRHHRRKPSTPRPVKETLHATSEYTNSEDDGAAIHRINQYSIKQEVGRGSCGAVHLAVDQYGNEFAVKEFSKSRLRKRAQSSILRRPGARSPAGHLAAGGINVPLHRRSASDIHKDEAAGNPLYLIREEIAIMKKLSHPNLVSLLEVLDDPSEDSLYMVLELCKNGVVMKVGMHNPAEPHDPERCRTWFRDLILGIEYLHAQGVVHRDIKPDNLLLTEDDVLKIVDFGVSEMFEKDSDFMTTKSAGSPAFLPPELCVTGHGSVSGRAADIWSMGVTLYCLYFGRVPFEKINILELCESIRSDDADLESAQEDDLKDLLIRILEKDPAKRIEMKELRDHPWVTRQGTDPLLSAQENTADLVQPPTEEEMKRAITSKLSNLLVVMKAVNRFKGLISHRRPEILQSILGQPSRIVLPPEPMNPMRPRAHKTQSYNVDERVPIEQALVREGIHREIDVDKLGKPISSRDDAAAMGQDRLFATKKRSEHAGNSSTTDAGKQMDEPPPPAADNQQEAHSTDSTSQEFRFLAIGAASTQYTRTPQGSPPIVSESPPAVEDNVYEKAYHEEVERIRQRNENATLYVTKRVQDTDKYKNDRNMLGIGEDKIVRGFNKLAEKAKDAKRRRAGFVGDGDDDHDEDEGKDEEKDKEKDDKEQAGLRALIQGGTSKTGMKKLGEAACEDFRNMRQDISSAARSEDGGKDALKKLAQATITDLKARRDKLSNTEDAGDGKDSSNQKLTQESAFKATMKDVKSAYSDRKEQIKVDKSYDMPGLKTAIEDLKSTQAEKSKELSGPDVEQDASDSADEKAKLKKKPNEDGMPALKAVAAVVTDDREVEARTRLGEDVD